MFIFYNHDANNMGQYPARELEDALWVLWRCFVYSIEELHLLIKSRQTSGPPIEEILIYHAVDT
jgi:hypothetical protein